MIKDETLEQVRALMREGVATHRAVVTVAESLPPDELFAAAVDAIKRRVVDDERRDTLGVERSSQRHSRACQCDTCQHRRDVSAEIGGQHLSSLLGRLGEAVKQYTDEMRMTWTAELLAQPFSLPDGTRVTWGSATIGQHQERTAMLKRNAVANLEAAIRHQQAIDDLESAGVDTLDSLVAVAA